MGNSIRGFMGNLCGAEESKRALAESCEEKQPQPKQSDKEDEKNKSDYAPSVSSPKVGAEGNETVEDGAGDEHIEVESVDESLAKEGKEPGQKKGILSTTMNMSPTKLESFAIEDLDKKFERTTSTLNVFLEAISALRMAVNEFVKMYKKKDFDHALTAHKEALSLKEAEDLEKKSKDENSALIDKDNLALASDRIKNLLEEIPKCKTSTNETSENLDTALSDINSIVIKDYLRDEAGDKSFLSKFSVPGKYRRNVKLLKKKRKALDDIAGELKRLEKTLSSLEDIGTVSVKPDLLGNVEEMAESPGAAKRVLKEVEEEKEQEKVNDAEIQAQVEPSISDFVDSQPKEETVSIKHDQEQTLEQTENEVPKDTADAKGEEAASPPSRMPANEAEEINEIINRVIKAEQEPDQAESHVEVSPTTEERDAVSCLPAASTPASVQLQRKSSSQAFEEGKLVDYGSYLVLDPDQELMKRSRSLDSLTSRGSRPSMSRLGSFEIVTNFEVKVAEQAEAERIKKAGSKENSL